MRDFFIYKTAFALLAAVLLVASYRLSMDVPDQTKSNAPPLGESGAYMLCREKLNRQSADPDLTVIPGVKNTSEDKGFFQFVWNENSAQVGFPNMFGKVRLHNAVCVVNRSFRAITHLSIEK